MRQLVVGRLVRQSMGGWLDEAVGGGMGCEAVRGWVDF